MNTAILDQKVQDFIQKNLNTDLAKLVFKKSPFSDISTKELAEQIASKKAAEKKLPSWFNTPGIYFPPKLAIEQSSSELAAAYKSKISKGGRMVDLTGGMGVDAFYLAQNAEKVVHVERQAELSAIAKHNASVLNAQNIEFIAQEADTFLKNNTESWDCIYLDPSRRVATQKVFKLSDCEPNIVDLQTELLKRSPLVLVKTAPLLDIKSGLSELNNVREIHVLSINNEMKELLWLLDSSFNGPEPKIRCVSLARGEEKHFDFKLSEEQAFQVSRFSEIQDYIYEPDAAWLKSGCFKLITERYQLNKINQHTHLYTSANLNTEFPGRTFAVKAVWNYGDFIKEMPVKKANVITRNFPLSAPEINQKHKIKDGGEDYLLFCKDRNEDLKVVLGKRL